MAPVVSVASETGVEVFAAHRADDDLDDQPGLCRGALKRPESGYGI